MIPPADMPRPLDARPRQGQPDGTTFETKLARASEARAAADGGPNDRRREEEARKRLANGPEAAGDPSRPANMQTAQAVAGKVAAAYEDGGAVTALRILNNEMAKVDDRTAVLIFDQSRPTIDRCARQIDNRYDLGWGAAEARTINDIYSRLGQLSERLDGLAQGSQRIEDLVGRLIVKIEPIVEQHTS